jgi:RimJ/RimL family protein N-acetyltransferase
MSTHISIRKLPRSEKNLESILALELEVLPLDAPYSKINNKSTAYWWGAFDTDNNKLVGATCLSIWIPGWAFLARSVVKKDFRGQGLQQRFIKAREKFARLQNVHTIVTYVSPENIASANNLIRCGYELYIPQEKWGLQPFCYYFRKKI